MIIILNKSPKNVEVILNFSLLEFWIGLQEPESLQKTMLQFLITDN